MANTHQEGTIYTSGDNHQGETSFSRRTLRNKIANILLATGFGLGLFFLSPYLLSEAAWYFHRTGSQIVTLVAPESGFARVIRESNLKILNPVNPDFTLIIPKIDLNIQVVANVPVDNTDSYRQALEIGVAHAQGSYTPDQLGTVYLFGHSSGYLWNASSASLAFFRLNKLESGDKVNLFHQGLRFDYRVTSKAVVNPHNLSYLQPRAGENKLIMQTCWPPGTTWKRLVVVAEKS